MVQARNIYSYLEQSSHRCGFATTSKSNGGDGRVGALLGPGAQAGANVLDGTKFKQEGVGTNICDAFAQFQRSSAVLRRLRRN